MGSHYSTYSLTPTDTAGNPISRYYQKLPRKKTIPHAQHSFGS